MYHHIRICVHPEKIPNDTPNIKLSAMQLGDAAPALCRAAAVANAASAVATFG